MSKLTKRLRDTVAKLRRTPMPIGDVAPMLNQAADKLDAYEKALLAVNATAIESGHKFGVCDEIDNTGEPYQSQWLADLIAEAAA